MVKIWPDRISNSGPLVLKSDFGVFLSSRGLPLELFRGTEEVKYRNPNSVAFNLVLFPVIINSIAYFPFSTNHRKLHFDQ